MELIQLGGMPAHASYGGCLFFDFLLLFGWLHIVVTSQTSHVILI
jgi:hypothetical protein